jgi:hypothetical protein
MPLELLQSYLPYAAIAAGVVVLLWAQRDRLGGLLAWLWPASKSDPGMAPSERFATFYALRTWCQEAGHQEAVKALDGQVLPAIVQGGPKP